MKDWADECDYEVMSLDIWMFITDENGYVVFEGNRDHFSDCFFSNVTMENVESWAKSQDLEVTFTYRMFDDI